MFEVEKLLNYGPIIHRHGVGQLPDVRVRPIQLFAVKRGILISVDNQN
jgi:hypothetical protein